MQTDALSEYKVTATSSLDEVNDEGVNFAIYRTLGSPMPNASEKSMSDHACARCGSKEDAQHYVGGKWRWLCPKCDAEIRKAREEHRKKHDI